MLFYEGNGKVCTRVGQGLGNSAGGAAGGIGRNTENRIASDMPPGAFRRGFRLQICLGARGCVTYSAAIGRNLVFHWLQPEAVRYFSNEAAGTRITSAYSPR